MAIAEADPAPAKSRDSGDEQVHQFVGFTIGAEEFALNVMDVVGVERPEGVLRLPMMPAFVEGIMTIRDEHVPLVKLRTRFGLPERASDERTRVVVVETADQTLGYVVDSVTAVRRIPNELVEPTPRVALSIDSRFIAGLARLGTQRIVLLNPHEILREQDLAQLASAAAASPSAPRS